jgi:hypothetical protein
MLGALRRGYVLNSETSQNAHSRMKLTNIERASSRVDAEAGLSEPSFQLKKVVVKTIAVLSALRREYTLIARTVAGWLRLEEIVRAIIPTRGSPVGSDSKKSSEPLSQHGGRGNRIDSRPGRSVAGTF